MENELYWDSKCCSCVSGTPLWVKSKGTIQESRYHHFISSSQVVPFLLVEATNSKWWWYRWKRTLSFTRANVWQEDLSSSGHQLHICWCPDEDRSTCRNIGASEIPCSSSFSTTSSSTQAHTYALASLLAVKEQHEPFPHKHKFFKFHRCTWSRASEIG